MDTYGTLINTLQEGDPSYYRLAGTGEPYLKCSIAGTQCRLHSCSKIKRFNTSSRVENANRTKPFHHNSADSFLAICSKIANVWKVNYQI